ncbi:MAG: murein biosynthesis integral membrane protein MurJ [Lentisphaeria bacterium]
MSDLQDNKKAQKNISGSVGKSMLRLSTGILGSRITGLIRDIVMAWYWGGTGVAQAAFNLAFAVPNSLRALLSEGAFAAAFVPMLSERWAKKEPEEAKKLASRAISIQLIVLVGFVLITAIISLGCYFLSVKNKNLGAHIPLTFLLIPILMPYALLICQAGAFASVLNSLKKFTMPGLVPILFNVVQVCSILFLCQQWQITERPPIFIFSLSALLAGLLQLLTLMILSRRAGFTYRFDPSWHDKAVQTLCWRILPGLGGVGVMQINSLVDKILAAKLGPAAVGALNYSQHIVYLPVGVFGVAMGVVCLSNMSHLVAKGAQQEIANCFDYALRQVFFLILPCTVLFFLLREPILSLLFYRGAFNQEAVQESAWALLFYLPGLPAFCAVKIATTPIHARFDTATPVKIGCFCMILNIILNLILMQFLRQGGLALSTSICSWLNAILLMRINKKFMPLWKPSKTAISLLALLPAGVLAGICAWIALRCLPSMSSLPNVLRTGTQVIAGCAAGGIGYLIGVLILRRPEIKESLAMVYKR